VVKNRFVLFTTAIASVLLVAQAMGQVQGETLSPLAAPFLWSLQTCSVPEKEKIVVRRPFAERAKLKARLLDLLHESLYDDAKGILNVEREKEIKKISNKLRK
jgi:hypothetical protein